ncbi:hypothetical protein [Lysinibacter cavernae]|uniref:hypothetical protein n=1 Tax=Lysinibacter cavernae TaxID=1640652 RepID=UPI0036107EB4
MRSSQTTKITSSAGGSRYAATLSRLTLSTMPRRFNGETDKRTDASSTPAPA